MKATIRIKKEKSQFRASIWIVGVFQKEQDKRGTVYAAGIHASQAHAVAYAAGVATGIGVTSVTIKNEEEA